MFIDKITGEHILTYAEKMIKISKEYNNEVQGKFNGVTLNAYPDTSVEDIEFSYQYRRSLIIGGCSGYIFNGKNR